MVCWDWVTQHAADDRGGAAHAPGFSREEKPIWELRLVRCGSLECQAKMRAKLRTNRNLVHACQYHIGCGPNYRREVLADGVDPRLYRTCAKGRPVALVPRGRRATCRSTATTAR